MLRMAAPKKHAAEKPLPMMQNVNIRLLLSSPYMVTVAAPVLQGVSALVVLTEFYVSYVSLAFFC